MKNVLKSIGATLFYLAVYLVVNILVAIAFVLYLAVGLIMDALRNGASFDILSRDLYGLIVENAMLLTFLSGLFTLLLLLTIVKLRKMSIRDRLDLKPVPFSKLWPVFPLGLTLNLAITFLLSYLPIPEKLLKEYAESSSFLEGGSTLTVILAAVLMAPVLEEILLRGLILKSLQRSMPAVIALVIQAVIFGLLHGQIIWAAYASVLGFILGLVKMRYQSLIACIFLHFSFNASSLVLEPLMAVLEKSAVATIVVSILSVAATFIFAKVMIKLTVVQNSEGNEATACSN